jgi:hypothetical protein
MPLVVRPANADELARAEELVARSINDLTVRHGFGPFATRMRCLVHSGRRWRWPSRGTGTSDALAIAASQGMRFALPMVLMSNARLRRNPSFM